MRREEERGGDERVLVLFVLIPDCEHCRERIRAEALRDGTFGRVEIGYPRREGTTVELFSRDPSEKERELWEAAGALKRRLGALGYMVL